MLIIKNIVCGKTNTMPTYDIRTKEGEEREEFCSISKMEEMVKSGEWSIVHNSATTIVSHTGSIISKTPQGWKDLLKQTKKGSGRRNTINI